LLGRTPSPAKSWLFVWGLGPEPFRNLSKQDVVIFEYFWSTFNGSRTSKCSQDSRLFDDTLPIGASKAICNHDTCSAVISGTKNEGLRKQAAEPPGGVDSGRIGCLSMNCILSLIVFDWRTTFATASATFPLLAPRLLDFLHSAPS